MDPTKVTFGPTSIIGYLTSAAACIPLLIRAIEEGSTAAATQGANKWLALYVVVTTAVTTLIRGWQAAAKASK